MKRNTKKKKDFVVFLFLDSWATATASSVVTLSAQIKIWYDIFFTLVLFHSVFVLHSEKKTHRLCDVWHTNTFKFFDITPSLGILLCVFFLRFFRRRIIILWLWPLSFLSLCFGGSARVGGISSRQSAYFVPACERNGNVLSKTKFIDVYIFPFFLSVRMFLLLYCWFCSSVSQFIGTDVLVFFFSYSTRFIILLSVCTNIPIYHFTAFNSSTIRFDLFRWIVIEKEKTEAIRKWKQTLR